MSALIKLSGLFAVWEIAKFCIGHAAIRKATKNKERPELGCVLLMFELPYFAWGIWLLFADTNAAIILWSLAACRLVFEIRKTRCLPLIFGADCAMSAITLGLIFWGRL